MLKIISIDKLASSEDLEISRGEIGVSLEDNDPTKGKETSTKNRWRELPNQNTAVIPAVTQHSDNYKKDKLDKAKYTNFLGRTDQNVPVEVYDFAAPGRPVSLDDYFNKHTDTLQDDQQQYDTRNFGKGKLQPKQYSNFLYKNELLHVEDLTKLADLESKKPYLLQQLNKAKITGDEAEKIIKQVNEADPTGDKAVYTQWIVKQYLNGNFKGEEDIEKFKDTLNKFTKLKNSKKIEPTDLNQYNSYGDLSSKVKEILDSTGGYTSNREEETTKEREGIKFIDGQNGIELYVVDTPEAASKNFRNTEWCVKDPKWFNQYAKDDPNFYYFTKGEEPFLLLHKNDFRNVNDGTPSEEDLAEVAPFMIEHNLPRQYVLLSNKIITKEDENLFSKAVNRAIEDGRSDALLEDGVLSKGDSKLFDKAVNKVIEESDGSTCYFILLRDGLITKEDGDAYDRAVNKFLESGAMGYLRFRDITREDGELFDKAVTKELERGESSELLARHILAREDGELFTRAVNMELEKGNEQELLGLNIITQEELQEYKNKKEQQTQEQSKVEEQQEDINKTELLHITTLDKIAAEQDSSATTSITPSVTDNVSNPVTQKPVDPVTQGKGGGKPVKGPKAGGTGVKPLKALYMTDLSNIHIIADRFEDGVTRTELPESSLRRFRQQDANDKNKKEQDETREKMKGKPNKPLHNVPKKDVYAWGNDDLNGGTVFYSNLSIPQMGDLSEMS